MRKQSVATAELEQTIHGKLLWVLLSDLVAVNTSSQSSFAASAA